MEPREVAVIEQENAAPLDTVPVCANCGTALTGPFCANCGQHVADFHQSVWRLVRDFFENTLSWDSKVLRTLGPLFRRPGFLTLEFMAGRRVRYVHPLRLFLFTSAVCIALWHFGGDDRPSKTPHRKRGAKPTPAAAATPGQRSGDPTAVDKNQDANAPAPSPTVPPQVAKALAGLGIKVSDDATPEAPAADSPTASPSANDIPSPEAIGAGMRKALKGKLGDRSATWLGNMGEHVADHVEDSVAEKGVEGFSREVSENYRHRLSWVVLAMLPVFALMLRGLYWRKDTFYFLHLVFSLHYHTFLLVFWTLHNWVGTFLGNTLAQCSLLLVPVYLYLALRRVYGGSGRRTWVKVVLLGGMHLLALSAGLAFIAALAVGY